MTNDIAVSMRTPTQHAEDIKIRYACALSQLANPDESIEVPSVGDRPARRLARQTLAEIVEPRDQELFGLVREELRRSGFEEVIAAGVVLTGGSAKMEGAIELADPVGGWLPFQQHTLGNRAHHFDHPPGPVWRHPDRQCLLGSVWRHVLRVS